MAVRRDCALRYCGRRRLDSILRAIGFTLGDLVEFRAAAAFGAILPAIDLTPCDLIEVLLPLFRRLTRRPAELRDCPGIPVGESCHCHGGEREQERGDGDSGLLERTEAARREGLGRRREDRTRRRWTTRSRRLCQSRDEEELTIRVRSASHEPRPGRFHEGRTETPDDTPDTHLRTRLDDLPSLARASAMGAFQGRIHRGRPPLVGEDVGLVAA